ncbi:OsmC family peroxiredoxin [bacterium]|nr:OsmC family peroxiredoxin [bacterium]
MSTFESPLPFRVSAVASSGISTPWTASSASMAEVLPVVVPPEFGGSATGYSPEDLYALALENCFIATFKVFAEKSKLTFESLQVSAVLWVDTMASGALGMARIEMNIDLSGPSNSDLAHRVIDKTTRGCMILNSVITEKIFNVSVH